MLFLLNTTKGDAHRNDKRKEFAFYGALFSLLFNARTSIKRNKQMLGIRKMQLWLIYVLQSHLWFELQTQRILFSRRADMKGNQITKADDLSNELSFAKTLSSVISSKEISTVHWYVTKFYVIRNVTLKNEQWNCFPLILDLSVLMPSFSLSYMSFTKRNICVFV